VYTFLCAALKLFSFRLARLLAAIHEDVAVATPAYVIGMRPKLRVRKPWSSVPGKLLAPANNWIRCGNWMQLTARLTFPDTVCSSHSYTHTPSRAESQPRVRRRSKSFTHLRHIKRSFHPTQRTQRTQKVPKTQWTHEKYASKLQPMITELSSF